MAVLAVTAAAVLFATTGTARSLGPDGVDAWAVGTWRILIGSVALWALSRTTPRPKAGDRLAAPGLLLGGLGVAAYQPGFFIATDRCGVALGTLIALGSGPVFAAAIDAAVTRVPPTARWWTATTTMVIGVALLGSGDGATGVTLDGLGIAAGLAAGAGYAIYAVSTRRAIAHGVESTRALAWQFSIGALVLAPGLALVSSSGLATGAGMAMVAHLGVLTVGVAYLLYGIGLRHLKPATAVSLTVIEPVAATTIAAVVLDERPSTLGWVGAGIVIIGFALLTRRGGRGPRGQRGPRTPIPTPSA